MIKRLFTLIVTTMAVLDTVTRKMTVEARYPLMRSQKNS